MKAKVGRVAMIVSAAATLLLAVVRIAAGDGAGSVATQMSSVAQLCIGDGGSSSSG
ncbi:MAG: hypothetical protein MUQ10_01365 [Anaerolineae bacterium]|nr:hypothetical protein [Anaerolineae bacterium]